MIWKGDGRVPTPTYNFENAVSKKNCEYIIDYCSSNYKMTTAPKCPMPEELRPGVSFIDGTSQRDKDIQSMMQNFITEANDNFFHYDIAGFEVIQFAKYEDGNYYDWHQDYFPDLTEKPCRKLTVGLSLSEYNESGGHLEFFNGEENLTPEGLGLLHEKTNSLGTAIVFDSREWHRVTPVKNGVRYSLVCWSQGPYFK